MRNWISIIVGLLFVSCTTYQIPQSQIIENKKQVLENTYFANSDTDYVYKVAIDVYGNQLGGLLVVKKINPFTHRLVFTTEFGNKLLDVEITPNSHTLHYIVDELDKGLIKKTLISDFRLLVNTQYDVISTYETPNDIVYQCLVNGETIYVFEDKNTSQVYKLLKTSRNKEKVNILFESKNTIFAQQIQIEHLDIKLHMDLNYLKN